MFKFARHIALFYHICCVCSDAVPVHTNQYEENVDNKFKRIGSKLNLGKGRIIAHSAGDNTSPARTDFASLLAREVEKNDRYADVYDDADSEERDDDVRWTALKKKYQVPRMHARPVERIVNMKNKISLNSHYPQLPDYYSMLGVPKSASRKAISQRYRVVAKSLHPDKNPHPDAKIAFDFVTDAHERLSDDTARALYDKALKKQQQRSRSISAAWNVAQEEAHNLYSRLLLLLARCQRGELREEFLQLKTSAAAAVAKRRLAVVDIFYKVTLAPSLRDKISVVISLLWGRKISLLLIWTILSFAAYM